MRQKIKQCVKYQILAVLRVERELFSIEHVVKIEEIEKLKIEALCERVNNEYHTCT